MKACIQLSVLSVLLAVLLAASVSAEPNLLVNPGFEEGPYPTGAPTGWYGVPGTNYSQQLIHPFDWDFFAHGGYYCAGLVSDFSEDSRAYGIYQQVATNPGDVISLYAWSCADGYSDGSSGTPYRFGEINNQLGLDPTGAKPSQSVSWPSSVIWSGQLSSMKFKNYTNNQYHPNGEWRRIGVCAIAQSTVATIFLRSRNLQGAGWSYNWFDDVQIVPPTAVSSVRELKSQPIQTNVNLSGGNYAVTYVCSYNPDPNENAGKPYFYIQDLNGGPGIKVTLQGSLTMPPGLAPGKKVNIIGTLDWGLFRNARLAADQNPSMPPVMDQQLRLDKPCGELVLRAVNITVLPGSVAVPAPVAVSNQTLGGASFTDPWMTIAGVAGGAGANNVGRRVTTWGKIVEINTDSSGYVCLVIDDGSKLPAPPAPTTNMPIASVIQGLQTQPGLFINTFNEEWPTLDDGVTEVQVGDFVILTGISGVRLDLDTDDVNALKTIGNVGQIIYPEAMKNMRTIKVEPYSLRYLRISN